MNFMHFILDIGKQVLKGGKGYWSWMALLGFFILLGVYSYRWQYQEGFYGHGLGEEVPWGFYIANFAYLVGIAAAAVMLVIPAYIFNYGEIKRVVIIGEGMAIAACITAVLFILVSLGRPDRLWHILPFIGRINLPRSMLAWDVIVINSYLFINVAMLFYALYNKYCGKELRVRAYTVAVVVAIILAISIHTVTAFLFSSNISRPFWHSAILGPRFLASAFTSGPALIILALQIIRSQTPFTVGDKVISILAIIMTVSLQINMFLLGAEAYTEFYSQTKHSSSAEYLLFGLKGYRALVTWFWAAIVLNTIAMLVLSFHALRNKNWLLNLCCMLIIVGIWMEKGMGLVVPGFIPTPLGDIVEYIPTLSELGVSVGVWAVGIMIFTLLLKMAIPIETEELKSQLLPLPPGSGWGQRDGPHVPPIATGPPLATGPQKSPWR